jgi:hypothetical protein
MVSVGATRSICSIIRLNAALRPIMPGRAGSSEAMRVGTKVSRNATGSPSRPASGCAVTSWWTSPSAVRWTWTQRWVPPLSSEWCIGQPSPASPQGWSRPWLTW